MYVHIHIYCMYFTDACSLAHSPPTTAIGPARPRTSPPPLLPRCPHTPNRTSPKPLAYPQVSTISSNAPFSTQQLTTQRPCAGPARPHNDPRSDPSVYVHMHICCICFADACSPTHSPCAPTIGLDFLLLLLAALFAAPTHPSAHPQGPLHTQR